LKKHYTPFLKWPSWFQQFVSWLLRLIIRQDRINKFLLENSHLQSFEFIEKAFDELGFRYHFNARDIENIPARGGVIIFANHPLGALDGLSLLHLVSLVRRDVKIVANQLLSSVTPLAPLLLPVDNMKGDSRKQDLANIACALEAEQVVIFFPAGEVSRLSPSGIQDKLWDAGFL
jgi:putative hemolysin